MKKTLILLITVLSLAAAGGFLLIKSRPSTGSLAQVQSVEAVTNTDPAPTLDPNAPVKEFIVGGTNYAFNPSTITVNKGDNVKITLKDDDGQHNLVIDGYNVSTNVIGPGSQDTIQFVADKAGTYEYFCSVGSHRGLGMTGTLVVQ